MPIATSYSMSVGAAQTIPYLALKQDPAFPTDSTKTLPFDLTAYTLRFTLKMSPVGGAPYTLQKDSGGTGGVTITNAPGGAANIAFSTPDTLNLAPGVYYFDVVALIGAVQVPLTTGSFTLTERVSR